MHATDHGSPSPDTGARRTGARPPNLPQGHSPRLHPAPGQDEQRARTAAKLTPAGRAPRLDTIQPTSARIDGGGVSPSSTATLRHYAAATSTRLTVSRPGGRPAMAGSRGAHPRRLKVRSRVVPQGNRNDRMQ